MKISKICTLSAVIVGFSLTAVPSTVQAIGVNSAVDKIVKYISKKGSSKMCRKGSAWNVISIRSFSGLLCGASPALAGLAVGTCYGPNTEGFRDSSCFKKAKSKLGLTGSMTETEITEIAIKAMTADITKAGSAVAKIACKKAGSLPGAAGELAASKCPT